MKKLLITLLVCTGCASGKTQTGAFQERLDTEYKNALISGDSRYVYDELMVPAESERFGKEECKLESKSSRADRDGCRVKWNAMYDNKLKQHYFAADFLAVHNECESKQTECADPHNLENWLKSSHNQRLSQWREQQLQAYESNRALASSTALQNFSNQMTHFQQAIAPPPPQACQTNPNGIGGWTTTCH